MVRRFWYSVTPLTVIGEPALAAVTVFAVQLPGAPYRTDPRPCVVLAQLTSTEVAVRSDRYGARVSAALAPGNVACAALAVEPTRIALNDSTSAARRGCGFTASS